jgi:predicted ArsR family transcriptional regulator
MGNRPQHVDSEGGALRRAKALSTARRVDLLARLRAAPAPLTAGSLAEAMGIHHTAVRQHLAVLIEAGLVRPQPLPVVGRGRPRTGYTAVVDTDPYRELAGMLADAVRGGRTARDAGRAAGRQVPRSPEGVLATLRDEAQRLGFDPQVRRGGATHDIVLRTCPFADLATTQPDTVCELHVGLAEGIVDGEGDDCRLEVQGIRLADPHKGGCRIVVRERPT